MNSLYHRENLRGLTGIIARGHHQLFPCPDSMEGWLWATIRSCWEYNPGARLSMADVHITLRDPDRQLM